jgi:hypothetical protein
MDSETFERETTLNRQAYETLREQIRRDYAGKYVALGQGRVLAASVSYDDAVTTVEQLKPVPEYFLVFPADEEPAFEPFYNYWAEPFS